VSAKAYRALGFLVWQGGKWYVRRNYGRYLPSRRMAGIGVAAGALAVGAAVGLAARRGEH
jgi:hypothetical protein